ncbi:MAG: cation:proton antiporter [Tepidiforma sp.]|uniref:Na+/H+ antiporter subunit C n=1 Tax=Tepidiforma sp. TaxID=2682230 RepID=UPI0021DC0343|nr:Na+/H+ antiporter subunit C [Tepidiforma sp.]GIW16127.1 MAG: cation:proton antiporter [Tepidiforma sp.]
MELLLAVTVGWLYACGLYLLLRRTLAQVVIGLALLTNGTNLLIFTAAGLVRGEPPLIGGGETALRAGTADPLPQAMILTAIVIGFAIQAFAMVLAYRVYRSVGSDDIDALTTTEPPPPPVTVQAEEADG